MAESPPLPAPDAPRNRRKRASVAAPDPPTATPASVAGAALTPGELTRNRLDYLRWSCDQLAALLRGHQERKARLEAKAGAVVAVLNVFAGFVLTARWPASTGELGGALLAFRLLALAALSAVLACWFFAVKCGPSQGLNPVAFTADDGTTAFEDWAHRYARVRQTLLDALASVNPAIEHRAKWILRCEAVAAVAYALLLVVLVLEVTK